MDEEIGLIQRAYPFLSFIPTNDGLRIGVVENISNKHISFYDYKDMKVEDKDMFLDHFSKWWDCEDLMPCSCFLHRNGIDLSFCMKTIPLKVVVGNVIGPSFDLGQFTVHPMKRREYLFVSDK